MNQRELRELATCGLCGRKVLECGSPVFYTLELNQYSIDMNAIQRQAGLEMMLGSPALAAVMGPDQNFANKISGPHVVTVCNGCVFDKISLGLIIAKSDEHQHMKNSTEIKEIKSMSDAELDLS